MKVTVIGPFPPPVHGSSKNLLAITEEIEVLVDVKRISISPSTLNRDIKYHCNKCLKVIKGLFQLFITKQDRVYTTADAGFGMFYTLFFILIVKLKKIDLVIHHRSFAYIDKENNLMKILYKLTKNNCHVFLCSCMKDKYETLYGKVKDVLIVSNAKQVEPATSINMRKDSLKLGYLSNLTKEKGFDIFLDVFEELMVDGVDVEILIAGPASDSDSKTRLNKVLKKYSNVKYFGPVYGDDKIKFFSSLDVFVFPTDYKNEAQPNVLFEAMAYGNVILSTNKGCISSDISSKTGMVTDAHDFKDKTVLFLKALASNNELLAELKNNSLAEIKLKKKISIDGHDALIRRLTN